MIFEDALQIWSPGFLPYNMTVEDLLDPEHTSKPRNKLIAQIFYDLGLIERYGSGIKRILDDCRDANLPEPLFENFSGGFRIKFTRLEKKAEETQASGETGALTGVLTGALTGALSSQILRLIDEQPGIQRKTIVDGLGIPARTADRHLAELIAEGKIERQGTMVIQGPQITQISADLTMVKDSNLR